MILYTEETLDKAWQYDCKCRTRNDRSWIGRDQYRNLFEVYLDNFIAGTPVKVDIHIPDYMLMEIEMELEDNDPSEK